VKMKEEDSWSGLPQMRGMPSFGSFWTSEVPHLVVAIASVCGA